MNKITKYAPGTAGNSAVLMPDPAALDKHTRSRLLKFIGWLNDRRGLWYAPDLAQYRDHLLSPAGSNYAPETARVHLATLRGHYRMLITDNHTRDDLFNLAEQHSNDPLVRKAFVDEIFTRLANDLDPIRSRVKTTTKQDRADAEHVRLSIAQVNALLRAPGVATRRGLRDTAIMALLVCTGIREAELSALEVRDLRQRLAGELALHVRLGKGCKERLVPYGELSWVLAIVDKWLEAAHIETGPVFRGFYKADRTLRSGRLCVRQIEYILNRYLVSVDGELVNVKPHDLRRTYARRLHDAGVELIGIQQNLGHADVKTTLGYIGELDASQRRPPALFDYPLADLATVRVQSAIDG